MPKVWNIGNTTVRNPKRIENALKVFLGEGFSGNVKGPEREALLHQILKDKEVLDFEGPALDINGRKWRAAFYQLGFISNENYKIDGVTIPVDQLFERIGYPSIKLPYQITPAGVKLISARSIPEINEIYIRQFASYELPTSLERDFAGGHLKPFILFLQILDILQDRDLPGLSKLETGLFVQIFQHHTNLLANEIVDQIIEFRDKCFQKTKAEFKEILSQYLAELETIAGIKPDSIVKDYADTTFRYFSLTGLFARIANTIVIRNNKRSFVKELLANEPRFIFGNDPVEYFRLYYGNDYPIPTDDINFALAEINALQQGIRNKYNPLAQESKRLTADSDPALVQNIRFKLIEYNNWEREEDFANEQRTEYEIQQTLKYLKTLNNVPVDQAPEIDDKPAYLEWAVWRSFLAINDLISAVHETRRFPVDEDFLPRNTAPGGGSDLIFEFATYVLIVEVTLTVSHRQMSAESEPVRRHAVHYKSQYPEKDVYCLFIAPSIDNNVAETFRIGVWYNGDQEEFVNIVPMTISDFIIAIETLLTVKFTNSDFKALIERSLVYRNVRAPQWKTNVSQEVANWRRRLTAR